MEKYSPKVGDAIQGDQWEIWNTLIEGDSFTDSSFPGCDFRYVSDNLRLKIACNIKVTGKPHYLGGGRYKSRIKIEVVGDGEPSTFFGGVIFHDLD